MEGFFSARASLQSGVKEHNKDSTCNKPHARDLFGKNRLVATLKGKRDSGRLGGGWAFIVSLDRGQGDSRNVQRGLNYYLMLKW